MGSKIKIGDKVAYAAKFLRDIGDYSKTSADKRGKVIEIVNLGDGLILCKMDGDFKHPVNSKNLRVVKNKVVIE